MVHRLFKHKDILSSLNILRDYCVIILFLFIAFLVSACTSNQKEDTKQQQRRDFRSEPASQYQTPYNPIEASTVPASSVVIQEESAIVEESVKQEPQPIKEIKLSRYYEEGYVTAYR